MASLSFNSAVFSSSHRNSSSPSNSHRHCVSSSFPSSSYSSLVRLGSATSIGFDRIPRITTSKVFASASASSSSSSSFDDFNSGHGGSASSKKKLLAALIQEIEPLDISVIQKDIPPTTLEAMKRTISGMLGLLPSNQFQVMIEALWESLFRLLLSSIMTGYTLRNAEYRLCLERNLGIHENNAPQNKSEDSRSHVPGILLDSVTTMHVSTESEDSYKSDEILANSYEEVDGDNLGEITAEAQSYILHLQSRLSSVKKELHEVKRKNAALQMQQFVGEEKNDLLDYLRSLTPEKVAELSEPSCPEVREMIQSVVHGLLAYLSPRMHTKAPPSSETNKAAAQNPGNQDFAELIEDTSLPFQPAVSLTRDYLARYLFWCMLLGHYLRGLEYRLELTELFHLPSNCEDNVTSHGTEQAA